MTSKAKTPLIALVKEGLSFVICPTGQTRKLREIEGALAEAKLACASTRWLQTGSVLALTSAWMYGVAHGEIEETGLVVLTQLPLLTRGYNLPYHRIVWLDVKPATTNPNYAHYLQACQLGGPGVDLIHHTGAIT
jgi:hypothetical protein